MKAFTLFAFAVHYALGDFDEFGNTEAVSLLQLGVHRGQRANNTVPQRHNLVDPGLAERALCPHEIEAEEDAAGGESFGCDGTLKSPETVLCSFWGEPHITNFFTGRSRNSWYDVFYKTGYYKLAAAKDGSWEIQTFNCGRYAQSVAIRLGKTIIEFISPDRNTDPLKVYVNGKPAQLPFESGDVKLGESSLRSYQSNNEIHKTRKPGSCIDYGDVSIDFTSHSQTEHSGGAAWVGLLIEAAADAVTTNDDDPNAICNWDKNGNWDNARNSFEPVPPEHLLFSRGNEVCSSCRLALRSWECSELPLLDAESVRLSSVCRANNIAIADAASACDHLKDKGSFFTDCQVDFCFSGGETSAAVEAEVEEAHENPQPICIGGGGNCDPGALCCNALRDKAKLVLDNVVSNDICGTEGGRQQLRFGRALTQNGVDMDLVVNPVGEYACGSRVTNDKFGSKTAEIGLLAVAAGTEATFEFRFVKAGTSEPVEPTSMMLSFLDLDQGKNDKQRESIQVCNGAGAVVTDDNELDIVENGACTTVTSTTHGTSKDNPASLEGMSQVQRARSVAFLVSGSSFQAKFSVSKKGHNPRKFMFAGHPGVACVLK